jgi:hypothetical protein
MSKKGSRASGRAVLASGILLVATGVNAATPLTLTGWDASAVDRARTGALKRLESDEGRKVFTDFTDAQGRSLQQNLEEWSPSPAEYIDLLPFVDGSSQALCRKTKTALVASPGVRREHGDPRDPPHPRPRRGAPARRPDQHRDHAARRGAMPVGLEWPGAGI